MHRSHEDTPGHMNTGIEWPVYAYVGNPLQERVAELESLVNECFGALLWCGGSPDFSPEGQAYQGWCTVVVPTLEKAGEVVLSRKP